MLDPMVNSTAAIPLPTAIVARLLVFISDSSGSKPKLLEVRER
jgi:hypothetical protein